MSQSVKYVGLDVHKDTIAVAVAEDGKRSEVREQAPITESGGHQLHAGTHMLRTGKSKACVWRWQERFAEESMDGLLHDKTRHSRIPPLQPDVAERVVALTLTDPPVDATHWTATMMAGQVGIKPHSPRGNQHDEATLSPR